MVLEGTIINGAIVLDRPERLPEGARVEVVVQTPAPAKAASPTGEADCQGLREFLLMHAGTVPGLPSDLAEQQDHYIHGTPKR